MLTLDMTELYVDSPWCSAVTASLPVNRTCLANAGLMLGQRRKRRPNIKQWVNVYCIINTKQYRFFEKKPSVLLPCNPRRTLQGFPWGCMVIVLKGSF